MDTKMLTRLTGLALVLASALPLRAGTLEYYHTDALGSVRVVTDDDGDVIERHDYLPFGEECTTGPCASNPGVGAGQPRKFTGKERDIETGFDYFGARYYANKMGRLTTVDPLLNSSVALLDPQKWNRYAYARNNPLARIDPDGRDDFVVFRPLARSTDGGWAAIQASASKLGHTVTIYNGDQATAGRYTEALQTGAHVGFTGHTVEELQPHGGLEAGSVMTSGNVSVGTMNVKDGTSVRVPDVKAASVAIFGCNSEDLRNQYGGVPFTGSRPSTNTVAQDAGAAAYIDRMVRGGTIEQAGEAARRAMVSTTTRANASPRRVADYATPQVCTNGSCN